MWKEAALALAVLVPAGASQFWTAPKPAAATPAVGQSFAPACRYGAVVDSRPDPTWVRQSFARDSCVAPTPPAALNGAKATRPQVVAAMAAAKVYADQASSFQKCVATFVAARKLAPSQRIIEDHRIAASQRSAQLADAQAKATVMAFNAYGSGCDD